MAGRRRTRGERAADGSVRPTAVEARAQQMDIKLKGGLARAATAAQRLAVTSDYLRSAAKLAEKVDPVRVDYTLDEMARRLRLAGAELVEIGRKKR